MNILVRLASHPDTIRTAVVHRVNHDRYGATVWATVSGHGERALLFAHDHKSWYDEMVA